MTDLTPTIDPTDPTDAAIFASASRSVYRIAVY